MSDPLPIELRERAVRAYENSDDSYATIAERFEISVRSLIRWVARFRETGSVEPYPKGGGNFSKVDIETMHRVVAAKPGCTVLELLREYNERVDEEHKTSRSSFMRALHRERYVYKKNGLARRSTTARTSAKRGRSTKAGRKR